VELGAKDRFTATTGNEMEMCYANHQQQNQPRTTSALANTTPSFLSTASHANRHDVPRDTGPELEASEHATVTVEVESSRSTHSPLLCLGEGLPTRGYICEVGSLEGTGTTSRSYGHEVCKKRKDVACATVIIQAIVTIRELVWEQPFFRRAMNPMIWLQIDVSRVLLRSWTQQVLFQHHVTLAKSLTGDYFL
jgi:hypothetical protein